MRNVDPSSGPLQQAPYSLNVASNQFSGSLVQIAEQSYILSPTNTLSNKLDVRVYRSNRMHEDVIILGGGASSAWGTTDGSIGSCQKCWRTRDNMGRGGKEKNDGRTVWQRGSSGVWHHQGLKYRRARPWLGLRTTHSGCQVYDRVDEGRGKGKGVRWYYYRQ